MSFSLSAFQDRSRRYIQMRGSRFWIKPAQMCLQSRIICASVVFPRVSIAVSSRFSVSVAQSPMWVASTHVRPISPISFSPLNAFAVDARPMRRLWHARPALFRVRGFFSVALTPPAKANKHDGRKFRAERDAGVFAESSRKNWPVRNNAHTRAMPRRHNESVIGRRRGWGSAGFLSRNGFVSVKCRHFYSA